MSSYQAEMLKLNLFHGSHVVGLTAFDLRLSDPDWPFGPGIYMSEDFKIARKYANAIDSVYSIQLEGKKSGVIDLDRPWGEQSMLATAVGARLFIHARLAIPERLWETNARDVLDRVEDKKWRNEFLAQQGIWMMHGHLGATEDAGSHDRGCQFLLLDTFCVMQIAPLFQHL